MSSGGTCHVVLYKSAHGTQTTDFVLSDSTLVVWTWTVYTDVDNKPVASGRVTMSTTVYLPSVKICLCLAVPKKYVCPLQIAVAAESESGDWLTD
jgi:hypothetical protein